MHALSGTLRTLFLALSATLTLWTSSLYGVETQGGLYYEVRPGTPATLTFWNRPIVTLRTEIGNASPLERVQRGWSNIEDILATSEGTKALAIPATVADLSGYWIKLDGRNVISLIPEDVETMSDLSLDAVATQAAAALQQALDARREQQKLSTLLMEIGLTLAATLALGLVLWGIVRFHLRAMRSERLLLKVAIKVGGVDLQPFLDAMERAAVKLTSFGLGVIAVYVWLTYVLSLYPMTRPLSDGLAGYLVSILVNLASGALSAVPGLFTVLVIFVLTRMIVRAVDSFFGAVEHGILSVSWLAPDTAKASRRLTNVLIWVFALTVAYPYIPGSSSDAFKGISVFVGLMISLGSAGMINQVMSGLVVAYSRALKAGEYVRIGTTEGTVSEVGMLSTKVITPKREAITVPNAVLVGSSITNYSRLADTQGAAVGTNLTIGYDTPWRQIHAMLVLAAERTAGVRKEPKPFVLQCGLSDYYAEYQLVVSLTRPETRIRVLSDLHANIQDVFNEFGVQIMSPHFIDQPAEKVWSPKDQWFTAPAAPPTGASPGSSLQSSD